MWVYTLGAGVADAQAGGLRRFRAAGGGNAVPGCVHGKTTAFSLCGV